MQGFCLNAKQCEKPGGKAALMPAGAVLADGAAGGTGDPIIAARLQTALLYHRTLRRARNSLGTPKLEYDADKLNSCLDVGLFANRNTLTIGCWVLMLLVHTTKLSSALARRWWHGEPSHCWLIVGIPGSQAYLRPVYRGPGRPFSKGGRWNGDRPAEATEE